MAGFGWSAGDLVSAISVIVEVSKALKDAGGAKEDYRESVAFLESLSVTLRLLYQYYEANLNQNELSEVKAQILLIQDPIDAFTKNVKLKYGSELGTQPGSRSRVALKGLSKKILWALWMKKESERLNGRIATPLAAIQMRLSTQIISMVSAVPRDVSTNIENIMRNTIPALLENSSAPPKLPENNNRMDQLASSSMIQQKLEMLPEILASRLEPEIDAILKRDDRQARELVEYHESLLNKMIQVEDRLQHEISTVPRQLSLATNMVIHELQVLSEATLLNRSLLDHRLERIQNQVSGQERNSNSENARGSRNRSILDETGIQPWREAGNHFKEFIRLILQGFYRLFFRLWPLFASFLVHLKVMQRLEGCRILYMETWRFLRSHYQGRPGESKVLARQYTIISQDGHFIEDSTWQRHAKPNAVISMAVVLSFHVLGNRCPKCNSSVDQKCLPGKGILITCPNRECLLEFFHTPRKVTAPETMKKRFRELGSSTPSIDCKKDIPFHESLDHSIVPNVNSTFPIWLEVARSLKKVEYSNMREKVDAIALSTSVNQNMYFNSAGSEPYRHLLHAEKIGIPNKQVSEIETFTNLVTTRRKEITDLEHYFKRVHCIAEPFPPCRICSFDEYRYPDDIPRHMLLQHSCIYSCIFDFSGCKESFADKIQWKCHVESRHLNWLCHNEECPNEKIDTMNHYHGNFFFLSRKERSIKLEKRKKRAGELLRVSLRTAKQVPVRLGCPLMQCKMLFEGDDCWNKRMEHIGNHVRENAECIAGYFCGKLSVDHSDDDAFIDWALSQQVIRRAGKGFRLVVPE
ncbi:hypothetical protein EYC84_007901 [Monilinia fructicola]|uniref:Ubiquitin-like domain-containing protein n=1 Tax=Monilinia fructicola TaxID=38448 RepID=A0A5M9JPK4_MONFR|nr:hypothetical protein EYC84_007901 [Monilinia fructicola]